MYHRLVFPFHLDQVLVFLHNLLLSPVNLLNQIVAYDNTYEIYTYTYTYTYEIYIHTYTYICNVCFPFGNIQNIGMFRFEMKI